MSEMSKLLSVEREEALRKPIDDYVGEIQKQIDALRAEGTAEVLRLKNGIRSTKENRLLSKAEKEGVIKEYREKIEAARAVEAKNREQVNALIKQAEEHLKAHYGADVYEPVKQACAEAREAENRQYKAKLEAIHSEHASAMEALRNADGENRKRECKDEAHVYHSKKFDAKMVHRQALQEIKDRQHECFAYRYHLIDLLRMSKFTFAQAQAQKIENRRYTFNCKEFFLRNGLYIVIVLIFIALAIATPALKNTQLLTFTNIMNILQQASPRMFLALGVAGLILLTGTDLSIGRMVGMGMVASTVIMHQGINTGAVFGHVFDFTNLPVGVRAVLALLVSILLCTLFTSIAGFFTAKFKMHPFIATMSNMLIIFGIVSYATKGVSFGAIEPSLPKTIVPKINGFPTIILWAALAIAVVWFIWNKTRFGKNLYAVGGNPEAAAVSGINVFLVTLGAFILAGILYGTGSWLECIRMVGSGSVAYGQGWDMDAIAACVVGGVSFTGGIGKISGVVVGVLIFTSLTYALTILGIDTNLQFVFEGIIILTAVTLDCLKYVRKK